MKAKSSKKKTHKKKGVESKEVQRREASIKQLSLLDVLIEKANLTMKQVEQLRHISNCELTEGEAEDLINYLYQNQIDLIQSGFNYSATDITNKLKKDNG